MSSPLVKSPNTIICPPTREIMMIHRYTQNCIKGLISAMSFSAVTNSV